MARAQAAELAIRDLARVVGEVLDRWEGEPLLERVPYIYGGNPAEVAAIARRMAGIVGAPVPVEPIMETFNVPRGTRYARRALRARLRLDASSSYYDSPNRVTDPTKNPRDNEKGCETMLTDDQ